jgi:CRP/FNR family transcriptional regulator
VVRRAAEDSIPQAAEDGSYQGLSPAPHLSASRDDESAWRRRAADHRILLGAGFPGTRAGDGSRLAGARSRVAESPRSCRAPVDDVLGEVALLRYDANGHGGGPGRLAGLLAGAGAGGGLMPGRPDDRRFLLELLGRMRVFEHGSPEALATLAAGTAPTTYPSGSFVCHQGEPAGHVYVVAAGEVAIVSPARGGSEQLHRLIGPGQLFGELALLSNGRRTAGARATSPSTVWAIDRDAFWAFLEATPAAQAALLRQVVELLADREAMIDDLLSLDVRGRLAKALLGLAERHGQPDVEGGVLVRVRLTHRDLAGMVGASRENVSRALAAFRRRGFLDYDTEAIRILDPEALRRLL